MREAHGLALSESGATFSGTNGFEESSPRQGWKHFELMAYKPTVVLRAAAAAALAGVAKAAAMCKAAGGVKMGAAAAAVAAAASAAVGQPKKEQHR
ncbi:hypothetical protein AXG93_1231s1080 [Marchantia polymorpha subsp. ruderalis]|uniref:Uncharacterized protein n=3 Tax=Marchantia polymorpha TaxID=3197 RepID=A0A176VSG8_MARPO|nr:hypothetical protein AXG93_1231s1080 [Marchantia polymorpha subsp. ruderalis]